MTKDIKSLINSYYPLTHCTIKGQLKAKFLRLDLDFVFTKMSEAREANILFVGLSEDDGNIKDRLRP